MSYLLLKYLHIIAAVFLFGFGMGSYLYLIAANRSGDPRVIAAVARMVVRFDAWITTPAGVLQLLTGYAMVSMTGMPWSADWLRAALLIFFAVGALWLPVLLLQARMQRLAAQAAGNGTALGEDYQQMYRPWLWMGVAGFTGMFLIVLVMVTKQAPWQWL
ncbi:DUF2269 domain-containing protein [Pseudomonas soli]|jgi:uncharacterized membrane protein|uniref:DUF2269 domain-containing protein n=1 Tax=Pseudomonas soli TaxID=1306993 RepID=A0A1H9JPA4_9PSED|nr:MULTISPECIES: DUF2269 domain-containing protein [Pseudomonas]AIN58184.1 membrane protein [Pseudomonas soli]AUY32370.1 DUF2269 domain-containing protein [Pseudomonas sp. PONIH3]MCX5506788.1 DUF2269 domain-containing protein [Pseudomonas sp. BJa3]MDT3712458.1 DUF2269 domain-containing protein [Pseudomonas soli]MDT3729795.1 DUF2269 domain-containing protein [Pseudomonas soli]